MGAMKEHKQGRERVLVDEYSGIVPLHEVFYLQSLLYVANAADAAFSRFEAALANNNQDAVIVATVQEALTHAAALSRFFWSAAKTEVASARAAKLRIAFDMDGSPLQDRRLRNALEHFDERLDDFLMKEPVGMFFPGSLVGEHQMADEPVGQVFKLVDPSAMIFVILGEKFDFGSIHDEVVRLLAKIHEFDQRGRLPMASKG